MTPKHYQCVNIYQILLVSNVPFFDKRPDLECLFFKAHYLLLFVCTTAVELIFNRLSRSNDPSHNDHHKKMGLTILRKETHRVDDNFSSKSPLYSILQFITKT